jgi:hypothetical protein
MAGIMHFANYFRAVVVARGADARPADVDVVVLHRDAQTHRAEKGVLDLLHQAEVVGEVHDAGHVGLGKLHAPEDREF